MIADLFAPLVRDPAARGLLDDAAFTPMLGPCVITMDAIVEGRHFLPDDPIETVASKALRVNLSDLAAKGARPLYALVALQWPDGRPASEIARFAAGLGAAQDRFGFSLLGGDTTATPGPLTISVTMIGALAGARCPARADAKAGDEVWVSGTIGDGYLGLQARLGRLAGLDPAYLEHLTRRYRLPEPRVELAALVSDHANAAMDVSDGLAGDAGKIAAASGLAIDIEADAVPLSPAASAWASGKDAAGLSLLLTGGDDYEILLTAPAEAQARMAAAGLTRIGACKAGAGVRVLDAGGAALALGAGGHAHLLGC